MAYIKKLVMQGFKSFANKTELPFDEDINVILGPNGSGKSNVSDALCFVLGRLSSKSLRAAKSSNLIFQGSSIKKPSQEASVEIVFDNSDKTFNVDSKELHIKRIVRKRGTSIYKINHNTKTRQEVLEMLSQAGIDPNGFNIVLQGEIARLIKMRPEERREIIEEVAGISIYESRKQKSLREIEKTEQKLKEVGAVLRERTNYLKNLETERKQALKFKELEKTIKQCKASIIKKNLDEKTKQAENIGKEINKNQKYKETISNELDNLNHQINQLDEKINEINKYIQKTTGYERESLNDEITDLNAKVAADMARKENFEKKLAENEIRKQELENNLKETEKELQELKKKSPIVSKRQDELKRKKSELEKIEEQKSKVYSIETEFKTIKERIYDKEKFLERLNSESKLLYSQINHLSEQSSFPSVEHCEEQILTLKTNISKIEGAVIKLNNSQFEISKKIGILDSETKRYNELKTKMPNTNICPLCQSKLTKEHLSKVVKEADEKIIKIQKEIKDSKNILDEISQKISDYGKELVLLKEQLSKSHEDLVRLNSIEDKKHQMKNVMDNEKIIKQELEELNQKRKRLEEKIQDKENIEEKYSKLFFELQEISSRTDENLDTNILYKEREIESIAGVIKNIIKSRNEIKIEVERISNELSTNSDKLNKKQKDADILNKKFKKMYEERTEIQENIKQKNILLVNKQNALNRFDEVINNLKIEIARINASQESLEFELKEFENISFISGSLIFLQERLRKSEIDLSKIGSVNLRALETYDKIKEEYESVAERVEQLEKERDDILKIIHEIDVKKKKTFMKTFNAINELFTNNFGQLSVKGKAFLEIQNKEDIFEGGINIIIRIAKGKYFDVTSLSGGEQTLVALSLIFAIQEYNPYCFYILDEIDAALDKRNAELLSNLLKKYMKSGQYIIISHNDSIIAGSDVLYGVSMNQGISKVISLKIEEKSDEKKKN